MREALLIQFEIQQSFHVDFSISVPARKVRFKIMPENQQNSLTVSSGYHFIIKLEQLFYLQIFHSLSLSNNA